MDQLAALKNKLGEKHGIKYEKKIYSTKGTIEGSIWHVESFGISFNYVGKRFPGKPTYVERHIEEKTIPPAYTCLINTDISPVICVNMHFLGTDNAGNKAWYKATYFYRENNPNNITITEVMTILKDVDSLVHVEYNNGYPVYAAFQKGKQLIVHSFIGKSETVHMQEHTIVKVEAFNPSGFGEGIDNTQHIFFSFDDNNIYLNNIIGTLYTQLDYSGYEVSFNSSKIFTRRGTVARIASIEPIDHQDKRCSWFAFSHLEKCTAIITYSDGKKQLLIINNILGPKRRVFKTNIYDDIEHIKGNFHATFSTDNEAVSVEEGLMFKFTKGDREEYYFISANKNKKDYGRRRVYKRESRIVPAKPDNDTDD